MGAWGTGPFDNDDAGDWVFELEDDGVAAVRAGLELSAEATADRDAAAVAAATVVALAHGLPVESSAEVDDWFAGADPATLEELRALAPSAAAVLHRVLDGSELAELHDETSDEEWRERLVAMEAALRAEAQR